MIRLATACNSSSSWLSTPDCKLHYITQTLSTPTSEAGGIYFSQRASVCKAGHLRRVWLATGLVACPLRLGERFPVAQLTCSTSRGPTPNRSSATIYDVDSCNMRAHMQTPRSVLRVGQPVVQPLKARSGLLSTASRSRHSPAIVRVPVSARAGTTLTPAQVVTTESPTPFDAAASMLGPLGKSLLQDVEVRFKGLKCSLRITNNRC